jgi:hypothetical protein
VDTVLAVLEALAVLAAVRNMVEALLDRVRLLKVILAV